MRVRGMLGVSMLLVAQCSHKTVSVPAPPVPIFGAAPENFEPDKLRRRGPDLNANSPLLGLSERAVGRAKHDLRENRKDSGE